MSVSSSRRRFLEISAGLAGKVAATGAVSLPVLASMSRKANALGWRGWDGPGGSPQHCFVGGTRILTPDGEIAVEGRELALSLRRSAGHCPSNGLGVKSSRRIAAHGIGAWRQFVSLALL